MGSELRAPCRQAEALRCWRALVQHGLPVAHLDEFFAPLSALLGPPDWGALLARADGRTPPAGSEAALARLGASVEAYLLVAALVVQARCPPLILTAHARAAVSATGAQLYDRHVHVHVLVTMLTPASSWWVRPYKCSNGCLP